jgi:cytochrome c-type biogenesis protein
MALSDFITSFGLGLLTPVTAACVLPLYPAFILYLSRQFSGTKKKVTPFVLSLLVSSGVILFMLLLGLIFTSLLEVSLTKIIGIVSPLAFSALALISLLLIFDIDLSSFFPQVRAPTSGKPLLDAFIFGFFFGAIVVPCNPLFIAALFAKGILSTGFLDNLLNFLSFGLGISFPLIILSLLSEVSSSALIRFFLKNKKTINLLSGLFMLAISIYYLLFVFRIQELM